MSHFSQIIPRSCINIRLNFLKTSSNSNLLTFSKLVTELEESLGKALLHMDAISKQLDEIPVSVDRKTKHYAITNIVGIFKLVRFRAEEIPKVATSIGEVACGICKEIVRSTDN